MIEVAQNLIDSLNMHTDREMGVGGSDEDSSKSKDDTRDKLEMIRSKLDSSKELSDEERMKLIRERMKLDRILEIRHLEERLAELKGEDIDDEDTEDEEDEEDSGGMSK